MMRLHPVVLVLLMVSGIPARAFALGGDLDEPSLSIGDPVDQKLYDVLKDKQHKFTGGYFINWNTTLGYRGDAEALNRMFSDLEKIDGLELNIRFSKDRGSVSSPFRKPEKNAQPRECQWTINHWAGQKSIGLTVYLGDQKLDITQLRLPPMRGAAPRPE
jgi:hypothetical protein